MHGVRSWATALALFAGVGGARAQAVQLPAPEVFAPGVVSGPANDGAPTFSPDGDLLLFGRSGASWSAILESHRVRGRWSPPSVASFSGPASDQQPSFSPDGRYVVFPSSRLKPADPATGAPASLVTHIWRVDRTANGWSAPVELPEAINIGPRMFKPSVAANGDIYLMSDAGQGKGAPKWRLFRAAARPGGGYDPAQPLVFSGPDDGDVDPYIAPDQSFIIFSSNTRRKPSDGHEHLFLARRQGEGWGAVVPIRYADDAWPADDGEAQVSPDGKALYFTSSRSPPIHRARTRAQMLEDFARLEAWDDGDNNAWAVALPPGWLEGAKPRA